MTTRSSLPSRRKRGFNFTHHLCAHRRTKERRESQPAAKRSCHSILHRRKMRVQRRIALATRVHIDCFAVPRLRIPFPSAMGAVSIPHSIRSAYSSGMTGSRICELKRGDTYTRFTAICLRRACLRCSPVLELHRSAGSYCSRCRRVCDVPRLNRFEEASARCNFRDLSRLQHMRLLPRASIPASQYSIRNVHCITLRIVFIGRMPVDQLRSEIGVRALDEIQSLKRIAPLLPRLVASSSV